MNLRNITPKIFIKTSIPGRWNRRPDNSKETLLIAHISPQSFSANLAHGPSG